MADAGVVAWTEELDEFCCLGFGQGKVFGVELDDYFFGGWVLLAQVCRVAESEGGGFGGDLEWLC